MADILLSAPQTRSRDLSRAVHVEAGPIRRRQGADSDLRLPGAVVPCEHRRQEDLVRTAPEWGREPNVRVGAFVVDGGNRCYQRHVGISWKRRFCRLPEL